MRKRLNSTWQELLFQQSAGSFTVLPVLGKRIMNGFLHLVRDPGFIVAVQSVPLLQSESDVVGEAFLKRVPGVYPGEHPLLALWDQGRSPLEPAFGLDRGQVAQGAMFCAIHRGVVPPFQTAECELPAATYVRIIERLETISIPLVAEPLQEDVVGS